MTHPTPPGFAVEPFAPAGTVPPLSHIPHAPLRVLKFGSSVLRSVADLPRVVGEIYRQRRAGRRMIVVVSALEGETDALLALARQAAGSGATDGIAELVSLGEEKTAALLRIACARLGLDAKVCLPEEMGIATGGGLLEATPLRLDVEAIRRETRRHDLVIVPGFVGIDASGARSLLGRGGSDFSAIFIGGEAQADCVRLYKDVDGVFDHDPADGSNDALRFDEVSWADCLKIARPLLQPRSVEYAMSKGLRLEVETIGSDIPTVVGPATRPPARPAEPRRLRIAIAGYGTVGQAVLARLRSEPRFRTVSILVRKIEKPHGLNPPVILTASVEQFMSADADVLIEATSSVDTGLALSRRQLSAGRHVVSASKKLAAADLAELHAAATGGARLLCSAAVGGGTPMLETVALARDHGGIREIKGVLSGTVNFVLTRIAVGAALDEALDEARRAGFAEADPGEDLSGRDAAAKLRILAAAAFDARHIDIEVEQLDDALARQIGTSGERWLQLATLNSAGDEITGRVQFLPARLAPGVPMLRDEQNFVSVRGDDGRAWIASGRGAGGLPTAEAIVADLYDLARGRACNGSPARDPQP